MSHKDGCVVLSAWVDPVVRDHAREAARAAGIEFSRWVERAVHQTMARESADRALAAAVARAGAVIEAEGCDCDCEHDSEGHDHECERCLACRVEGALRGAQ